MKFAVLFAFLLVLSFAADIKKQGELLYKGKLPLVARLAASEDDLAPAAARCVNCHGPDGRGVTEAEVKSTGIGGVALTRPVSRRGGPPSAYTLSSFRTALRQGHDPAHVVLARAMPRYDISDADSEALWAYLLTLVTKD